MNCPVSKKASGVLTAKKQIIGGGGNGNELAAAAVEGDALAGPVVVVPARRWARAAAKSPAACAERAPARAIGGAGLERPVPTALGGPRWCRSREDVLKQEAERERERNVTRTVDIIWTHFDTDGNGELDQNEFAALVSETLSSSEGGSTANFSPSEMEELMQMIDTDGDGSISRAEFKQLILSLTGLEPEKRDEIAVLSIVMCKATMFVEARNQSSKNATKRRHRVRGE